MDHGNLKYRINCAILVNTRNFNCIVMIDYTPRRQYKEIVDNIPPKNDVKRGRIVGYLLLILYIVIIGWGIMGIFPCSSIWNCTESVLGMTIIAIFIGLVFMFVCWLYLPVNPRLKADYANVIKDVIGFDFGDDFKLCDVEIYPQGLWRKIIWRINK